MIRLLIRLLLSLASSALGLLAAAWLLDDFRLSVSGFVTAVVVFTIAQSILTPFILKVARNSAPPLLGGIGIVATLVALIVAALFPDGLVISGIRTWILASLVVWFVTALGGWALLAYFLSEKRSGKNAAN